MPIRALLQINYVHRSLKAPLAKVDDRPGLADLPSTTKHQRLPITLVLPGKQFFRYETLHSRSYPYR